MLTQFRHLAVLWHGALTVDDVPLLSHFGDEASLRRIKVSCASDVVRHKQRQIFTSVDLLGDPFLCQDGWLMRIRGSFDVDFRTTCALRAERAGGVTVLESVQRIMKPA